MITKLNVFQQFLETFRGWVYPDSLYKLRKQSVGSRFLYALIVSLIAGFIPFLIFGIRFCSDSALQDFFEDMVDFTYADGEFICGERFETNTGTNYIVVDTDRAAWVDDQRSTGGTQGTDITPKLQSILRENSVQKIMFVSRTNIVMIRMLGNQYQYQEAKLSDVAAIFGIKTLTKEQVLSKYKGVIMRYVLLLGICMIPFQMGSVFFCGLIWSLAGLILAGIYKNDEKFPDIYWMSFCMWGTWTIVINLLKVVFHLSKMAMFVVALVNYIITMRRVLKDAALREVPVNFSNTIQTNGVIEDDFERFMQQGREGTKTKEAEDEQ